MYLEKSNVGEDSDFANAINIPNGSISVNYQYDSDSTRIVKIGMKFNMNNKEYVVTALDMSNVVDDIGFVSILAKEVTNDENA